MAHLIRFISVVICLSISTLLSGCYIPKDKPESWADVTHVSSGDPDFSGIYNNIGVADNESCSPKKHGRIPRECLLSVVLENIHDVSSFDNNFFPTLAEFLNTEVAIGKSIDGLIPIKIYKNQKLLKQFKLDIDKYYDYRMDKDGITFSIVTRSYNEHEVWTVKPSTDKSIILRNRKTTRYGTFPFHSDTIRDRWYKWEPIE